MGESPSPLPRSKRRIFTAAMVLVPVLFFAVLEGGLRLAGYGDTFPLFVPVENHPDYLYQNRNVAQRYFNNIHHVPNSQSDFFKATRDSSTLRIFVQGGSTAAGFPFYYGGSFSRMLEQRLQQTFPSRTVEVVNTAMSAVNSYTLLDLADEIIAQDPDLVLIYAGHNEYYGALGVGSTESLGGSRFLVNLYLRLRHFRTVQAVRALMAGAVQLVSDTPSASKGTLMERMVEERAIPLNTPAYRQGLRQFRGNVSDLLARYEKAGVPVFIGTPASNLRGQPPFANVLSDSTDEDAWRQRYERGVRAARHGDTTAAIRHLNAAIRMDSLGAEPYFLRAEIRARQGRYRQARADYRRAKDRDALRFRAPSAINRIIRQESRAHDATLVPTRKALAEASPHRLIGPAMMTEHLHPTIAGQFVLADAFYEALREANATSASWEHAVPTRQARRDLLVTTVDSLAGVYRILRVKSRWPYQPPGVTGHALDTLTTRTKPQALAAQLLRKETSWMQATQQLYQHYVSNEQYEQALQTTFAIIQQYPFLASPYVKAGDLLLRLRHPDQAYQYYAAAADRAPTARARGMMGAILLQRGDLQPAIQQLQQAIDLNDQSVQALYNLSVAYRRNGQLNEARKTVRRLLTVAPNHRQGQRLQRVLAEANS